MGKIIAAPAEKRRISAEAMTSAMKYAPQDGFKLTADILNQGYTVIDVNEGPGFNGEIVTMVTLANDNHVINLSLNVIKKSRTLGEEIAEGLNKFKDNTNIFTRSDAQDVWNSSRYIHSVAGMKAEEEFEIPETMFLAAAIIAEDRETEKPAINPFLYKGYSTVVADYRKRDEFPTMEDFREELKKPASSGRIAGLSVDMTEPTLPKYVKEVPADYRHTLIFKDFAAKGE